ncbi:MAG: glycogen debranching enzyme N-terminal domain-containing protein [Candidatus Cryptobacteroides sp.]|nr:glycogen debranching enzyme N-terminal domain-containing protein [Bacteroidales bacterium]MDY6157822.1 glycogen debranching enzyme N-terminal domain-containing protein [Candidatus Cryptobacteroides sp.]
MAFIKFNKSELVNIAYSLKKEILCANKTGAYCNTSILTCNTRRYHGLLAVTLDRFGGDRYLLLSDLDESLIIKGKQFNLGIHCYGDIYEPRGHKYVVDFSADPVPQITYKVGEVLFRKSILLAQDRDQVLIKYELLESPAPVKLILKPFLAFRNIHDLTHQNSAANTSGREIPGGMAYCMYANFPDLHLQLSDSKSSFVEGPHWNNNITYSDEYRRGFDCREDLFVPGTFECTLKTGASVVFSASLAQEEPSGLKRRFNSGVAAAGEIGGYRDQLCRCADSLIIDHNNKKRINAGLTWLYNGLLRETLLSLPGLTLYAKNDAKLFEEILDNLIADEQERLFRRTTQVEAPLSLACILQDYVDWGADEKAVWKKYGSVVCGIVESYLPGVRAEIAMQPNGLLWAQKDRTALSWMNAYVDGYPVTERAGYQVETNALWYNAVCYAIEMEQKYGRKKNDFVQKWIPIRDMIKANYQKTFWNEQRGCLADYVDNNGQNMDIRPNQLCPLVCKYSPIDDELAPSILRVVDGELVTSRGIRTLSPRDVKYKGVYEGAQRDRDLAYHQGCTRPCLLDPYVKVSFRIKGPSFIKKAEWLVEGFYEDLGQHGVGAFSELYDGDPPHAPHGAISSALSTAALLTVEHILDKYREEGK